MKETPHYRMDGGIAFYEEYLPGFEGKKFSSLMEILAQTQESKVKIIDFGAGNFTFAREVHKRWAPNVEVAGISVDDFLSPEEKETVHKMGIQTHFIRSADAPDSLQPEYHLAVSVLTSFYDPGTDYADVMWKLLAQDGIGLLDNVPYAAQPDQWKHIEHDLRSEGYRVEIMQRPHMRPLPVREYKHVPIPRPAPAPTPQRNIYLREMFRLQQELVQPIQNTQITKEIETSLAFQKDSRLVNIGERLKIFF